jgi:hypothetical protein
VHCSGQVYFVSRLQCGVCWSGIRDKIGPARPGRKEKRAVFREHAVSFGESDHVRLFCCKSQKAFRPLFTSPSNTSVAPAKLPPHF